MFVSSPSSLPGPSSSVHKWLLSVVTLLAMASSLATSLPPDQCLEDPTKFALQMHTIGSVDSRLWAITNDNWTVYELVPCKQNVTHCMVVSSPVAIDTKWPKLAETVKSAAGVKDFNFAVNNSVVMDSSDYKNFVLAMYGDSFKERNYFGFDFGTNDYLKTWSMIGQDASLWISSDVKDNAYRLLDSGKQIDRIKIVDDTTLGVAYILDILNSSLNICNVTQDGANPSIQFMNTTNCTRNMSWTVLKAVHHLHQFYFFAPDKVYTFSDSVQTSATTLESVSYDDFFHCHKSTTITPLSSPSSNSTHEPNATSSTPHHDDHVDHWKGPTTHSPTVIFILIGGSLGVAAIAAIVCAIHQIYVVSTRPDDWYLRGKKDYVRTYAIPKNSGGKSIFDILNEKDKQQLKANQQSKAVANDANKAKPSTDDSKVKSVAKVSVTKVSVAKVSSVQTKADSKVDKPKSQA